MNNAKNEMIEEYAAKVMGLAKDTITVKFRFFDAVLAKLKLVPKKKIGDFACDGEVLYYDPNMLLKLYLEEPNVAVRVFLHVLLHCVFRHYNRIDKKNEQYWNLAADIAVENTILELGFEQAKLGKDNEIEDHIRRLNKNVPKLTAEYIYKEFLLHEPSKEYFRELKQTFFIDNHELLKKSSKEEYVISEKQWEEISRRIRADLKSFSKNKTSSESLENNLDEAVKERYDYKKILERFTVSGEEVTVNDEEFDYVYYTYGLSTYGKMPLIEPLEYRETNKIKEFVIAIDTSASCRGEIVKAFITKTYHILKNTENFFNHINVHIIQCDSEVRSDYKICDVKDFDDFIENGKITGFGSTDFRPVFSYVEELRKKGEFENLKGLIYFTDGYGTYPMDMPDYDVIFAFLNEDENRQKIPNWAIKVVLEDELNEYFTS